MGKLKVKCSLELLDINQHIGSKCVGRTRVLFLVHSMSLLDVKSSKVTKVGFPGITSHYGVGSFLDNFLGNQFGQKVKLS